MGIDCAMERSLNQMLAEQRAAEEGQGLEQESDDTSLTGIDIEELITEMLVSNEGEWIHAHHRQLMHVWKGLKRLFARAMPGDDNVMGHASFGIFASFVYRWTVAEDSTSSDNSTGDDSSTPPTSPRETRESGGTSDQQEPGGNDGRDHGDPQREDLRALASQCH